MRRCPHGRDAWRRHRRFALDVASSQTVDAFQRTFPEANPFYLIFLLLIFYLIIIQSPSLTIQELQNNHNINTH